MDEALNYWIEKQKAYKVCRGINKLPNEKKTQRSSFNIATCKMTCESPLQKCIFHIG